MPAALVTETIVIQKLFFLPVAVTIACDHFAHPQRDGQAELAWLNVEKHPKDVMESSSLLLFNLLYNFLPAASASSASEILHLYTFTSTKHHCHLHLTSL